MNKKRPLKNQLSEEVIRKVIVLEYKKGKVPAVIAHESGYHIKSVQKIIRKFASKRNYKRRKGAGRPKVLNQSEKTIIRNKIRSKPWLACKELANGLGKLVSPETIRVYLKSLGYSFKKPTKKPLLNDDDKFERLTWPETTKTMISPMLSSLMKPLFGFIVILRKCGLRKERSILLRQQLTLQKLMYGDILHKMGF